VGSLRYHLFISFFCRITYKLRGKEQEFKIVFIFLLFKNNYFYYWLPNKLRNIQLQVVVCWEDLDKEEESKFLYTLNSPRSTWNRKKEEEEEEEEEEEKKKEKNKKAQLTLGKCSLE
jgi:hypothetical protein